MVATREEIIEALRGALDECRGDRNVIVPVPFLEDLLSVLTEEDEE